MRRWLFIPDCHRPDHDRKAWKIMMAGARAFRPDGIVILGDFIDCYSVTTHLKDPRKCHVKLHDEISAGVDGLDELERLNAKRHIYVCGNHEDRIERYLAERAPDLYGMVSLPELMDLKERGWEWVPYRSHTKIGKVYVTHDVGHAGIYALRQTQLAFNASVIMGHIHRVGYQITGDLAGAAHVAASFGWLGSAKAADEYMHQSKLARDWFHGFGVGFEDAMGRMHLHPIPIIRGTAVVPSKIEVIR